MEKIKLADVSFKCAVLSVERNATIQKAIFAIGGEWGRAGKQVVALQTTYLTVNSGVISCTNDFPTFDHIELPELTCQQALDLLATVEKPEPVFEFDPFDRVLVRDNNREEWRASLFSHVEGGYMVASSPFFQMVNFIGSESLRGKTHAPAGWWEARDGKPVWVTK